MSALLAQPAAMTCANVTGRTRRAYSPVLAVALPRKMVAARRALRTERAALASMQVATEVATEVAEAPAKVVHLLTAERYHDFLAEHQDKVVVMDFYAVWCGPCKMIAPELDRMAEESDPTKLVFAKLDCGASNESKKLAMSLGIKALPTFHLYRNTKLADSMTGAKVKSLKDLIAKHL